MSVDIVPRGRYSWSKGNQRHREGGIVWGGAPRPKALTLALQNSPDFHARCSMVLVVRQALSLANLSLYLLTSTLKVRP